MQNTPSFMEGRNQVLALLRKHLCVNGVTKWCSTYKCMKLKLHCAVCMIVTQYVQNTVLDSKHKALLDTYYNMSKTNDTFSLPWFRCIMLYHVRKIGTLQIIRLEISGFPQSWKNISRP